MSKPETKVEILYPEYGNQGGDNGNYMYVEACLSPEHIVSPPTIASLTLPSILLQVLCLAV